VGRTFLCRVPLLVPVVAAVVLAAGCGGGGNGGGNGGKDATEWADGICGSIDTWAKSVRSAAGLLHGTVSKSDLQQAAGQVAAATNSLASDLKGLDRPNATGGQQAKASLDKLASQYTSEVASMQREAGQAKGSRGLFTAVSRVSSTLATMGMQLEAAFGNLDKVDSKGELNKAFTKASSCKALVRQRG
jgi:hypothetical protein